MSTGRFEFRVARPSAFSNLKLLSVHSTVGSLAQPSHESFAVRTHVPKQFRHPMMIWPRGVARYVGRVGSVDIRATCRFDQEATAAGLLILYWCLSAGHARASLSPLGLTKLRACGTPGLH